MGEAHEHRLVAARREEHAAVEHAVEEPRVRGVVGGLGVGVVVDRRVGEEQTGERADLHHLRLGVGARERAAQAVGETRRRAR